MACEQCHKEYGKKKSEMTYRVRKSKIDKWTNLCEELEKDVWGKAYKIVTKRIGRKPPTIPPDIRNSIIDTLFPDHPVCIWPSPELQENANISIDMEDLLSAVLSMNTNKAPGPDLIHPKIVRLVTLAIPSVVLGVLNNLVQKAEFPNVWKQAKVALIPKPIKKQGDPVSYRPICLLNTFGKLYEKVLLNRLLEEIDEKNILSPRQYGFLPGRSTISAIRHIVDLARQEMTKTRRTRQHCLLIAIDIRNAFNSASWRHIIGQLEAKGISSWLVNIIRSYLSDRELVDDKFMTAGVPQGSVVGPTLWNVLYDGILNIDMPEGVTLIAYADDLSVLIKALTPDQLETKAELAIEKIVEWMQANLLEIAPDKTEAILLSGKKRCRSLDIRVMGENVPIKKEIKYLGVILDYRLTFGAHMNYVSAKADKVTTSLARIMSNVGGAGEKKRKTLSGSFESVLLYAAPIWAPSLRVQKYRDFLIKAQRKMLIRIARSYRTVSNPALSVNYTY